MIMELSINELDKTADDLKRQMEEFGQDSEVVKQIAMSRKMLTLIDSTCDAVGLGLSIDDQTNVRLGARVLPEPGSALAKITAPANPPIPPLAGYAEMPLIFAAGGPVPEGLGTRWPKPTRSLLEDNPSIKGFGQFSDEDWDKLEKVYRESYEGVSHMSFVMRQPKEDEPMFAGIAGHMIVEDSSQYLETYKKSMELNNQLMANTDSDISIQYEIKPVTVGEYQGYEYWSTWPKLWEMKMFLLCRQ